MGPIVCGASLQPCLSNGKVAEGGLRDGADSWWLYAATNVTEPGGHGLAMNLISSLWYFFATAGSRKVLLL